MGYQMIKKEFLNNLFVLSSMKIEDNTIVNRCIELDHCFLYLNEESRFKHLEINGISVILLGYILDIQDENKKVDEILHGLLKEYHKNKNRFHTYLNMLNGRYILIFSSDDDTVLYTDATSMKPVFYYENWLFSSHEIIIKELLKNEKQIELKTSAYSMKNFLDYTNTDKVYRFNPNLYFSFKKLIFYRFFPREHYRLRDLDTVMKNTEWYIDTQVDWLKNNYKTISLSLTGGFDSKLSLALVKPIINRVETFTYMYRFNENINYDMLNMHKKTYYKDKVIVDNLIYNFNLNHQYFHFDDYKVPTSYLNDIKKHVSSHHSYKLSYLTLKEFNRESIHLKSTLYELAKLPHKNNDVSPEKTIKTIIQWAPKELRENKELLLELYSNYYERNLTSQIVELNYNLPLMLYWEYRMANWHGNLTQETDFIWETFVFINSRYILDQLISLPSKERKEKSYLTSLIKKYWPALNYFVPNSFETLEDKRTK